MARRGCPEAWDGDRLDEAYDRSQCSTAPVDGALVIATNDAEALRVTLAGLPGLAARPELWCPRATGFRCPDPDAELAPCPILQFGGVGLTEACDVPIEIVNRRQRGAATADLVVDAAQLRARRVNTGEMLDGADAGFALLLDDQPYAPRAADPLVVSIPAGADEGRERLTVRFSPKVEGILRGDFADGAGLKLATNAGELSAGVVAEGLFPRIFVSSGVTFEAERDASVSATVEIGAEGPGRLTIAAMGLAEVMPGLSFSPDLTGRSFGDGERAEVTITLAAGGPFSPTSIEIVAEAPVDDRASVPIRAPSEVPGRCVVTPARLDLGESAGGVLNGEVLVEAPFAGPCRVDRLDIGGPNPTARAEFAVDLPGCGSLPCDPGIDLCPATDPGCEMSSATIPIVYQNTDATTQDLAELRLTTNDLAEPNKLVVLSAQDDPCLPPTPIIEVTTDSPCAGLPVDLDGSTSLPGGRQTVPSTIVDYQWSIAFGNGMPEFIPPNAAMTQFTPGGRGVWFVSLHVLNDCGARSQTPAQVTLNVGTCD